MQGLKKTGLVLSVILFGPLFLLSLFAFTFSRTIGSLDYTKQVIADAGFYEAAGKAIARQSLGQSAGDPLVTAAVESAVSGDRLQQTLEPLIEGTYAWLDGTTEQPEFNLAVEPIKTNFVSTLTSALQARAASLPACSSTTDLSGEDIYSYSCIPPGTDVNATINDAVSRVVTNASLFSDQLVMDGSISASDAAQFGINDPSQNLPNSLPSTYQFLLGGRWYFVAGTILTIIGMVFLSNSWLYGVRKVGVLLVINGVFVLLTGLLLSFVGGSLIPTTSVEVTASTVNALEQASRVILVDNASMLKIVGVSAAVVGTTAIVISSIVLSKKAKSGGEGDDRRPSPPVTDEPQRSNPPASTRSK